MKNVVKSQASRISREETFGFYSQHVQNLDPSKSEQKVLCLFHDDRNPSLSINLDKGVWYCPACSVGGGIRAFKEKLGINSRNGAAKTIVAEYDYHDENGNLLFQTVRHLPKNFKQRRPDGNGGWFYDLNGTRRVPYRLPELLKSDGQVLIVEGEKDVETLRRKKIVATTSPMGAGKWRKEYNEFLRGRDVVIIPDNDAPGRKHADHVANSLWGVASSIKIISLSGLGEHEDVSDFFGKGHDEIELKEIIERGPALSECPEIKSVSKKKELEQATDFRLTDLGNAERMIAQHGDDLRYCEAWGKWIVWNQASWMDESMSFVMDRAKNTVRSMYAEASTIVDKETRNALVKHANRSESESRISAMVTLARSDKNIQVKLNEFDVDPFSFNVINGTVELRTGDLRPHRREDLLMKQAPVIYDADAKCPVFESFLHRIMDGNENLIQFLQRVVGYCLTGSVVEQCLFFLHGVGSNGKTTLIQTILSLFGESYAKQAAPDLLITKHGERHPTELADLFGCRFVATIEIGKGKRMAETLMKQLTGGDRIKARFMRQDFFEFEPTYKIFLAANHKPIIRGTDYAIWRRIHLIPFTTIFKKPANPPDLDLVNKLKKELSGILTWAIHGCIDWQFGGLQSPDDVIKATESYRVEMDTIANFIKECCVTDEKVRVKFSALYDAYENWCKRCREQVESSRVFGDALTERGFASVKLGGVAHRVGIGLLDSARHDDHDDHDVI